jgi:hypothetical protein
LAAIAVIRATPRLEPGPSAADPAVRDPPQPAPASPLPARRRAAETATPAGRSGAAPRPKTHSRRRHDQRISPGRMTWTGYRHPQDRMTPRSRMPNLLFLRQAQETRSAAVTELSAPTGVCATFAVARFARLACRGQTLVGGQSCRWRTACSPSSAPPLFGCHEASEEDMTFPLPDRRSSPALLLTIFLAMPRRAAG